jgi:magnesium transporter
MELTNQHLPFELTKEYLEKIQAAISEQNNEFIRTEMEELFPADITNILYELEGEEAHYLVTLLDTKLAAEIIINLDPDDRKNSSKTLPHSKLRNTSTCSTQMMR